MSYTCGETHSATLGSPLKWAQRAAAIVKSAIRKVAVMIHHRFFGPTLSPIRPNAVPRRKESSEVSACWSGLWNVLSEVANSRATARLSWTRPPAANGSVCQPSSPEWSDSDRVKALRTLETAPQIAGEESRRRGESRHEAIHDELPQGRVDVNVARQELPVIGVQSAKPLGAYLMHRLTSVPAWTVRSSVRAEHCSTPPSSRASSLLPSSDPACPGSPCGSSVVGP